MSKDEQTPAAETQYTKDTLTETNSSADTK